MRRDGVARAPGERRRRALLMAVLLATSPLFDLEPGGAAEPPPAAGQNLTQKAQRETAVPLQSLHPIVAKVMPAVVNVSVTTRGGAALGRLRGAPGRGAPDRAAPGPQPEGQEGSGQGGPLDELLRRFFGPGEDGEDGPLPPGARRIALGSGFIIDPSGFVVTNDHVVDQAAMVTVIFQDNSKHKARVVGRDGKTDLALLKIDGEKPLPFVQWGDSEAAQVGDWVMAVGNPFGLGGSVTAGIISARGRDIQSGPYDDFLQIDAPINRGNSGGPTFNMAAEVIGINTAIFSPTGGSVGIGFAVPANLARPVIEQLRTKGRVERGWLGVQIQGVTPEIAQSLGLARDEGALVAEVSPGSPAAKAGIRQGDVIQAINNRRVGQTRDLSLAVADMPIGRAAEVTIWRGGKQLALRPVIAALPDTPPARAESEGSAGSSGPAAALPGALGMQFAPLSDALRNQLGIAPGVKGVILTGIAAGSPAIGSLHPGDVVQAIEQQPVSSPDDAAAKLTKAAQSGKRSILMLVNRQGSSEFVGLSLG